jgi:hypothetical protein
MKFAQYKKIVMCVWQDSKPIAMASTNASPTVIGKVNRKKQHGTLIQIPCPQAVMQYNSNMGAIYRS